MLFLFALLLFLFGLEATKRSIKLLASENIEKLLSRLSANLFLAIITGTIITAILQSSSAVSIILISLLDAKLLTLKSAVGILLGANIGTTVTVQIISLPILNYYYIFIIIGIIIYFSGLIFNKKFRHAGSALLFLGLVFAALIMMTNYFKSPGIKLLSDSLLKYSNANIYTAIILGTVITGIMQSSSAVAGLTVSFAINNLISLKTAVAIGIGSNIGTCITAFIASLIASKTAKSLALTHFLFNLIGVLFIIPFFSIFISFITYISNDLLRQIANSHTLFNIINLLIFIPFANKFILFLEEKV
ncbi:Na/Pi cotransporter family protein [Natronospora cellulosivora (SeqCode)]